MKTGHRTQDDDRTASIRPLLAAELESAQAALEAQIEQLRHAAIATGDSGSVAAAEGQLHRLAALGRKVERASPESLRAMQAEVAAVVATAQLAAQQGKVASTSAHMAHAALHSAQAHAHKVTGDFLHDFYERRIFDPYLTFSSPEEEQAYRQREEARQRAIEAARALGTPEGELRALQLAKEQLLDAGRYGADRSPDYEPMLGRIDDALTPLGQAISSPPEANREAHSAFDSTEAALVSPELIAVLRATGAGIADQNQTGHGISLNAARDTSAVRSI